MKENLEKYLKEKRSALDVDLPEDDLIWQGIQKGMKKKRTLNSGLFWKVAAIFLFVVSTTYVVFNETNKTSKSSLASISPELEKQEAELIETAKNKWQIIQASSDDLSQLQFLFEELDQLKNVYKSYETDLKEDGANEFIIRALLDYHTKKIRILDNILHEIEKQKSDEKIEFFEL